MTSPHLNPFFHPHKKQQHCKDHLGNFLYEGASDWLESKSQPIRKRLLLIRSGEQQEDFVTVVIRFHRTRKVFPYKFPGAHRFSGFSRFSGTNRPFAVLRCKQCISGTVPEIPELCITTKVIYSSFFGCILAVICIFKGMGHGYLHYFCTKNA